MNKIPIQCPVLRRMLLTHIIEQIDGGDMDSLLRAGYSPEFLDNLRYRTTRDITNLANSPQEMWFSLSEQVISKGLHLLDMRREHAKLREYFVIHGASRRMVCAYFKLSHEEYRDLRAQLRPGGEPAAVRPCLQSLCGMPSIESGSIFSNRCLSNPAETESTPYTNSFLIYESVSCSKPLSSLLKMMSLVWK